VRLLLDTHALLWALSKPDSLAPLARRRLEQAESTLFVSAVSAWEMEIKRALGKLDTPDDLPKQMQRHRMLELPVHLRHVERLRKLPPLHRDPFDRLLVAQALADDLTIVTRDERILAYPVKCLAC
jgi:PIN domain nuclease of toxin-antitoxin system